MISTITTSTITTVTSSVTSITTLMGFSLVFGLIAVVTLIVFLAAKELVMAGNVSGNRRLLAQALDIGIVPLILTFGVILVVEIVRMVS